MKKLIIPFSILFVISLFARLLFGYYVYKVPTFAVLLTALTWISVAFGAAALVLTVLQIIKEFRDNEDKP